jgi:hypothetical protein
VPRVVLVIATGCMVVAALSFITVYTAISAFTDETWPDFD